jgi:hypothetical protein
MELECEGVEWIYVVQVGDKSTRYKFSVSKKGGNYFE